MHYEGGMLCVVDGLPRWSSYHGLLLIDADDCAVFKIQVYFSAQSCMGRSQHVHMPMQLRIDRGAVGSWGTQHFGMGPASVHVYAT